MRHEPELEQMINLLALSADILRKLAKAQDEHDHDAIARMADEVEGIADKLVDALFPQLQPRQ